MEKYTCQRPIHPGELLKEEIECRHLPQTQLAAQTGISYKVLNDILNCRRPLTTNTAMLFEAALGISAGLLMRMQLDYNMQQATRDKSFMEQILYGTTCPSAQVCGIAVSSGTHRKFPVPPLSPSWRRAGRLFSSLVGTLT